MIKKKELDLFLNKQVSIGVPHAIMQGKLFFFYGKLLEVTEKEIKLQTKKGFKIVQIAQVKDVHEVEYG